MDNKKVNKKTLKGINDLHEWDKNPRNTTKHNFERCIKQLKRFGQYEPLLINQDNIILGGNTRYRAMKELGFKEIWVTEVKTKNEGEMMEYVLSANDSFSSYDSDAFMNMLPDFELPNIEDFSVSFKTPITFKQIIKIMEKEPIEDKEDKKDIRKEIIDRLTEGYRKYLEGLENEDLANEDKYALWR